MATTGRFETREELVDNILSRYYMFDMTESDIARVVKVSATTVANILKNNKIGVSCLYTDGRTVNYTAPGFRTDCRQYDLERIKEYLDGKNYAGSEKITEITFTK